MGFSRILAFIAILLGAAAGATDAQAQGTLGFSKAFSPDTIGAGGSSTLTFTITNSDSVPHDDIAFTDTLPAGMTIIGSGAAQTCGGILSAPHLGTTISLTGGSLGVGLSCTVTAQVTATTAGSHINVSGSISSDQGTFGTATDTLDVDATAPVFTKSVVSASIPLGGISRLTYTIDNSANASAIVFPAFSETLPTGVRIADPANASTDCSLPNLTAPAGGASISFSSFASVASGASCIVGLDVTGNIVGTHALTSGPLTHSGGSAGVSVADLEVTGAAAGTLLITKDFTDDPVLNGSSATLEFTISNLDRNYPATDIGFTDDLDAMLSGTTLGTATPLAACGGTVTGNGTGLITLAGGTLPAGGDCTFSVSLDLPAGFGSYLNTTSTVTGTINGSPVEGNAAQSQLTIAEFFPLGFTKEFTNDPVVPGGVATMRFTITNPNAAGSGDASAIAFNDLLSAIVSDTASISVPPNPCGAGSAIAVSLLFAGVPQIDLTGGTLAGGTSCFFDVDLTLAANKPEDAYDNTTSVLSYTIGGDPETVPPAFDTLIVDAAPAAGPIVFSKSFTDDPVVAGGTANLRFSISAPDDATGDITDVGFTDDLASMGLVGVSSPSQVTGGICGDGTLTVDNSGAAPTITLAGATLSPSEDCTFDVAVTAPGGATGGDYTNTAGAITGLDGANPVGGSIASDALTIYEVDGAPLTLAKAFVGGGDFVPGSSDTVRFTITNINGVDGTIVGFNDVLSADVPGFAASGAATTSCAGIVVSGTTTLSVSGGPVPANTSCTVDVPVLMPLAAAGGSYINRTSTISSTVGAASGLSSALATAPFTVHDPALELVKDFLDNPVTAGDNATLQFTITNLVNAPMTAIAFTDDLDTNLTGATVASITSNTCGGSTSGTGTDIFGLTGGALGANGVCTIEIEVTVPGGTGVGGHANTTGAPTATVLGQSVTGVAASDTLLVTTASAPTFTKSFGGIAFPGDTATLTFTITNTDAVPLDRLTFTDDLAAMGIAGLTANAAPPNPCGAGSSVTGTTVLTLLGGNLAASGGTCTFDITLNVPAAAAPGIYDNVTSELSNDAGPLALPASDSLTVAEIPGFSKAFAPSTVTVGETSVLTFTIDNSVNVIAVTGLAFTDTFPAGMVVGPAPAASNTCGGSFTANAGDGAVSLSGGTVASGASCTASVTVRAEASGSMNNVSDTLATSLGTGEAASATLTVDELPLELAMAFAPSTIEPGQVSTLTYTMRNVATIQANAITLSDTLPAGVVLATPANASTTCTGGTLTAPDGGSSVSYTGGSLAASFSCLVRVDVTSATEGSHPNTTEAQSSTLGTSPPASDTLTVEVPNRGYFTVNVNSDTDGTFGFSSAEALLTFLLEVNGGTGAHGPVEVTPGSYSVSVSAPTGLAITDISCGDADSIGDATAQTISLEVALNESVVCTVTAQSSTQQTIDVINQFLTKRAGLILSSEPSIARRLNRLRNGTGASSLTFATGDLKSMLPFTAEVNRSGGSYRFSTSLLQARAAAETAGLAHGSTKSVAYVDHYRFDAWFEAQVKTFDADAAGEGHFAIAYLGADYLVTPNLLLGMLLQVDDMSDRSSTLGSYVGGTGWMVGPYMTARLAPNLFFDARLAAGKSTNDISPFGTYTDSFQTSRWLATMNLTGEFTRGAWTIQPNASLSYFEETQDSYVDSVGSVIPSQTVRMGEFKIGPTFTGHYTGSDGQVYQPYFSVDAIYSISDTTGVTVTSSGSPLSEGWRGRLKAGVSMTSDTGARLSVGASYDGLFRSGLDVWGLTFDLNVPLQKPTAR